LFFRWRRRCWLLALLLAPAVAQHTPIPQAFADR
jgi:hypothetical protein